MLMHVTSEPLSNFLSLYPKANDKVTQLLSKDFQNISDQDFRTAKNRICLFKELRSLLKNKHLKLDQPTCQWLLLAVLEGDMELAKANVKGNYGGRDGNKQSNMKSSPNSSFWRQGIRSVINTFSSGGSEVEGQVDALILRATGAAAQISDSQFLSELRQDMERYAQRFPQLKILADKARPKAFEHLEVALTRTLKKLTPTVHRIQVEECTERIKREHARKAEEEQDKLRVNLIKNVNASSSQITYSCVSRPFLMVNRDPKANVIIRRHTFSIDNVEEARNTYYGER